MNLYGCYLAFAKCQKNKATQSVIFNIIWGYGIIGWLAVSSLTMVTDRMFIRKGNYFIPLWV